MKPSNKKILKSKIKTKEILDDPMMKRDEKIEQEIVFSN